MFSGDTFIERIKELAAPLKLFEVAPFSEPRAWNFDLGMPASVQFTAINRVVFYRDEDDVQKFRGGGGIVLADDRTISWEMQTEQLAVTYANEVIRTMGVEADKFVYFRIITHTHKNDSSKLSYLVIRFEWWMMLRKREPRDDVFN